MGVLVNLVFDRAVIPNCHNKVAAIDQLSPRLLVSCGLKRLVVDCAVAKNADVGRVEKVWNAMWLWNRFLRFIRQTIVTGRQSIEKTSLKFRT